MKSVFFIVLATLVTAPAWAVTSYHGKFFPAQRGQESIALADCQRAAQDVAQRIEDYGFPVISQRCSAATIGLGYSIQIRYENGNEDAIESETFEFPSLADCQGAQSSIEVNLRAADFFPVATYCQSQNRQSVELHMDYLEAKNFAQMRSTQIFRDFPVYDSEADCLNKLSALETTTEALDLQFLTGHCDRFRKGIDANAPLYYTPRLMIAALLGKQTHALKGSEYADPMQCQSEKQRLTALFPQLQLPVWSADCEKNVEGAVQLHMTYVDQIYTRVHSSHGAVVMDMEECRQDLQRAIHVVTRDPQRDFIHGFCYPLDSWVVRGFNYKVFYKQNYPVPPMP